MASIEIWTAEDLDNVRNNLSGDYIQMADIDLSEWGAFHPIGVEKLGSLYEVYPFTGRYDGNGFKITNLHIEVTDPGSGLVFTQSLFPLVGGGAVFQNIHLEGHVEATGLGFSWCNAALLFGDIISNTGKIKIEKCCAIGTINAIGEYVSGFATSVWTQSDGIVEISQCYSEVDISVSFSHGWFSSTGGFVSYMDNYDAGEVLISDCYARGSIDGMELHEAIGGFIGYLTHYDDVGGLIKIENCYSTTSVASTDYSGGFIGQLDAGEPWHGQGDISILNCYYDSSLSGQSDTGKGEPRTTSQMKSEETFIDWDFEEIWGIKASINDGYPYLLWTNPPIISSKGTLKMWTGEKWVRVS